VVPHPAGYRQSIHKWPHPAPLRRGRPAEDVYVYTTKVGSHTGGYDEWTVDITDAVAAFSKDSICRQQFKGSIPLSIRTDNSRNLERIPSGMSDFSIYGGLYLYLNLVYTPGLPIDQLLGDAMPDTSGKEGKIHVRSILYHPLAAIATSDSATTIIWKLCYDREKKMTAFAAIFFIMNNILLFDQLDRLHTSSLGNLQ
jgi:hypothetical protein